MLPAEVVSVAEPEVLIRAQAIAEYPGECCGVVMDKPGERLLLACRNIQDELHAKDPERHPRDSRTRQSHSLWQTPDFFPKTLRR